MFYNSLGYFLGIDYIWGGTGGWLLATGSLRLVTGNWRLVTLAIVYEQLVTGLVRNPQIKVQD